MYADLAASSSSRPVATEHAAYQALAADLDRQLTPEGTLCVSIVSVPSRSCRYPITECRVYRAEARKSDGVITWRSTGRSRSRTSHSTRRGVSWAQIDRAWAWATELGVEYRPEVRHGTRCP